MQLQPLLLFIHLTGVVVWVGGMFFAYVCLRPTAVELFEPPQRLRLWRGVFGRFFVWVWWAVLLIAASGLIMIGQHGFAAAPPGWHLMMTSGLLMIGIYIYVATIPYAALVQAVEAEDWKSGGAALNRIRQLVGTNLLLGLLTLGFATLGRYLA
jgi:uncharacterized membrane protein